MGSFNTHYVRRDDCEVVANSMNSVRVMIKERMVDIDEERHKKMIMLFRLIFPDDKTHDIEYHHGLDQIVMSSERYERYKILKKYVDELAKKLVEPNAEDD